MIRTVGSEQDYALCLQHCEEFAEGSRDWPSPYYDPDQMDTGWFCSMVAD